VALALTALNEAFLFSKNEVIMLCIHGGVLWLRSSSNNTGWETEGKASMQSINNV
jgi:hypothetical protein